MRLHLAVCEYAAVCHIRYLANCVARHPARSIVPDSFRVMRHIIAMKLAGDSIKSSFEVAKWFRVFRLSDIKFEYESAIQILSDVALAFKAFAIFLALSKHHLLAII